MSGPNPDDRQRIGDFVFQDFREDVDVALRNVLMACRIEFANRFGLKVIQGHSPGDDLIEGSQDPQRSVGDVFPWGMWPQAAGEEGRQIPSWNPCFAAVIESDTGPEEEEPQHADEGGTRVRVSPDQISPSGPGIQLGPTLTVAQLQETKRKTFVLPVHTKLYEPDERYAAIRVYTHPDAPRLPKGTEGVVLWATVEKEQIPLFLPTRLSLICVNHAGDPEYSSTVYDLKPDNTIDEEAGADLHTTWRVVPIDDTPCHAKLTTFPILSWQLGLSGQDRHAGSGLVTDFEGAALKDPEDPPSPFTRERDDPTRTRTRDSDSDGTTTERSDSGGEGGDDGNPAPTSDEAREIQQEIGRLERRRARLESEIATLTGGAGQNPFFDPIFRGKLANDVGRRHHEIQEIDRQLFFLRERLAQLNAMEGTRTRDGGDGGETSAPGNPVAMVHACTSSKLSGPFEVGSRNDAHQIGVDRYGNPINANHLSTDSLFYGLVGDAPLAFEPIRYEEPDPYPLRARGHLRLDPQRNHKWACGLAPGLWRILVEVPFMSGPPKQNRVDPGGTAAAAGGGGAGGAGGGGPGDSGAGDNGQDNAGEEDSGAGAVNSGGDFGLLEGILGLPEGSITEEGVTGLDPELYYGFRDQGLIDPGGIPVDSAPLVGDNDQTIKMKLGGVIERFPTMPQTLRLGGGSIQAAQATQAGAVDVTRGGFVTGEQLDQTRLNPDLSQEFHVGDSADQDGLSWNYVGKPIPGCNRGTAQGTTNLAPPDVTPIDVINEVASSAIKAIRNAVAGLAAQGFGTPTTGGGIKDGYLQEGDGTGAMSFTRYDSNGVAQNPHTLTEEDVWELPAVASPSNPDTGYVSFFAKADGLYFRLPSGTEVGPFIDSSSASSSGHPWAGNEQDASLTVTSGTTTITGVTKDYTDATVQTGATLTTDTDGMWIKGSGTFTTEGTARAHADALGGDGGAATAGGLGNHNNGSGVTGGIGTGGSQSSLFGQSAAGISSFPTGSPGTPGGGGSNSEIGSGGGGGNSRSGVQGVFTFGGDNYTAAGGTLTTGFSGVVNGNGTAGSNGNAATAHSSTNQSVLRMLVLSGMFMLVGAGIGGTGGNGGGGGTSSTNDTTNAGGSAGSSGGGDGGTGSSTTAGVGGGGGGGGGGGDGGGWLLITFLTAVVLSVSSLVSANGQDGGDGGDGGGPSGAGGGGGGGAPGSGGAGGLCCVFSLGTATNLTTTYVTAAAGASGAVGSGGSSTMNGGASGTAGASSAGLALAETLNA